MLRRFFLIFLSLFSFLCGASAYADEGDSVPSPSAFQSVPDDCRPWAYYFWIKGNVSKESITADLTRMKELGFGGVLVFDSRGYHEDAGEHVPVPVPVRHEFMSLSWQDLILHLITEADRLGMKVSLNLSNTGGSLRGPWDFAADGPRTLVTQTMVPTPGEPITILLRQPVYQRYYRDVALIAIRVDRELNPTDSFSAFQPAAPPADGAPTVLEAVDLTDALHRGRIDWVPPAGESGWSVVRFGSVVIGDTGSVDILNPKVTAAYFDKMAGTLLSRAAEMETRLDRRLIGRTLTGFYNVSWEGANPNWTSHFDRFFSEKRGYDIFPYMPILAGMTVKDQETTRRFLTDFHKTVADAFRENCYRKIGELCHRENVFWHSEDGGPWNRNAPMFREADMLTFWGENDIPQGEFWVSESFLPTDQSNAKFVASASHIYGRGLVALESFTHMTRHWSMYPAILKPSADQNMIDGGNMFIWHTYTAPVPDFGKPGIEYFAGTHINSNVTWQRDAEPFVTYIGRCQSLLRAGLYTADFCAYVSDKNYRIWGRGRRWNDSSGWGAPNGTAFDLLDTRALLTRLEWKDGRFFLPDGMSYRWLVFDPIDDEFPLAALEKILALAESGGRVILGPERPKRTVGLSDGPDADARFAEIVERLWADGAKGARPCGRGIVYTGVLPSAVIDAEKVLRDFDGPFDYHHRHCVDGEIYFIVNPDANQRVAECMFRARGEYVSRWDPVTGEVSTVKPTRIGENSTTLSLALSEFGSCFIVFSDTPPEGAESIADPKTNEAFELTGPWHVRFDPAMRGPAETVFEELSPWNENADPNIRYYSGSADYETTFTLSAEDLENSDLALDVGRAGVIARIEINGADAGVLWTSPWKLPLGKGPVKELLREGENRLTVRVTNTWTNRLIRDAQLPPEERLTQTNVQFYSAGAKFYPWQGYAADDPLRESGLVGPVRILK
ncbi:MAG: hypothetical protein J6S42_01630 [Thermoguttaceae bacterium]|nr:hypothetical protein [Thermoguttaceae bacterium]